MDLNPNVQIKTKEASYVCDSIIIEKQNKTIDGIFDLVFNDSEFLRMSKKF